MGKANGCFSVAGPSDFSWPFRLCILSFLGTAFSSFSPSSPEQNISIKRHGLRIRQTWSILPELYYLLPKLQSVRLHWGTKSWVSGLFRGGMMSLIQIARPARGMANVCSLLFLFILYLFSLLFICFRYLSNKYKQCSFFFFSEKSELLPWFYLLLCKYLSNWDIILFTFVQTSTKLRPLAKYFFLAPELYLILPSIIQLINQLYTSLLRSYYG